MANFGSTEFRPFLGLGPSEEFVKNFFLVVNGEILRPNQVKQLDPRTYRMSTAVLHHELQSKSLQFNKLLTEVAESSFVPREAISLNVTARFRKLKQVRLISSYEFGQIRPKNFPVTISSVNSDSDILQSPFAGVELMVSLVTNKETPQLPLRPWRKGTVMARSPFRLETHFSNLGFITMPLSNDARKFLHLPTETLRYMEIDDPLLQIEDGGQIRFWIDDQILKQISTNPSSSSSKYLQRQFFVDAFSALLMKCLTFPHLRELTSNDLEGTLLGKMLDWVGGIEESASPDLRAQIRTTLRNEMLVDPSRLIARVESQISELGPNLLATLADS